MSILKPGTALFEPAALIGLAAGVLGALAVVAVWRMPKQESATAPAERVGTLDYAAVLFAAGPV